MTARPASTYRASRRNAWKRAQRLWREDSHVSDVGGIRYLSHASLPQVTLSSRPASVPSARVRSGRLTGPELRVARHDHGVGRPPA